MYACVLRGGGRPGRDALLPAVQEGTDSGEARCPDGSVEDRAGGTDVLSTGLPLYRRTVLIFYQVLNSHRYCVDKATVWPLLLPQRVPSCIPHLVLLFLP